MEKIDSYEFTKKEIRAEFKATTLGKKINRQLICIVWVTVIFIVATILSTLLAYYTVLPILSGVSAGLLMITCYFDGKRDGAISQFKVGK